MFLSSDSVGSLGNRTNLASLVDLISPSERLSPDRRRRAVAHTPPCGSLSSATGEPERRNDRLPLLGFVRWWPRLHAHVAVPWVRLYRPPGVPRLRPEPEVSPELPRARPLPDRRCHRSFGRPHHAFGSCSALVVRNHFDGLLRTRAAGVLQPAAGRGSPRFTDPGLPTSTRFRANRSARGTAPRDALHTLRRTHRAAQLSPRSSGVSPPDSRTASPRPLPACRFHDSRALLRRSGRRWRSAVADRPPSNRPSMGLVPLRGPAALPLVPVVSRRSNPAAGSWSGDPEVASTPAASVRKDAHGCLQPRPPWGFRRQRTARISGSGLSRGAA